MKRFLLSRLGVWLALASAPISSAWAAETTGSASRSSRPNVVLIVTDDHGYHDLGVQGATDIRTPHLDSLAANGIRFTQGYVNAPICGPSRAALLTGRYQTRFGFEANSGPNPAPNFGLPLTEKTLANYLKEAGYATGAVGKWHLGDRREYRPIHRGFDEYYGFLHGARSYKPQDDERPIEAMRRGDDPTTETRYITYEFNDEAVSFIERHREEPFFLYLAYNAVHSPMHRAPGLEGRFPHIKDPMRLTMATMLAAADDGVGRVLETLRRHNLEENTLIVFLSDNGGAPNNNASLNTPLSGAKGQMLEGGIRIPFIVQWKGNLPAGRTYDKPVIAMDVLPTALAAAGIPAGPKVEGVNLLPYLRGENPDAPHGRLFWRQLSEHAARVGDWKMVHTRNGVTRLFNLAEDLGEKAGSRGGKTGKAEGAPGSLRGVEPGQYSPPVARFPGLVRLRNPRRAGRADFLSRRGPGQTPQPSAALRRMTAEDVEKRTVCCRSFPGV